MTTEQPKPPRFWQALSFVAIGVVLIVALLHFTTIQNNTVIADKLDSTFTDQNQTRAELLKIIDSQRSAVYSSYPLEHAYCDKKVADLDHSDRANIKIEGTKITETVICYPKNGAPLSWILEFDQMTGEYKESQRIFGGSS